jgi:hypothetical protein
MSQKEGEGPNNHRANNPRSHAGIRVLGPSAILMRAATILDRRLKEKRSSHTIA